MNPLFEKLLADIFADETPSTDQQEFHNCGCLSCVFVKYAKEQDSKQAEQQLMELAQEASYIIDAANILARLKPKDYDAIIALAYKLCYPMAGMMIGILRQAASELILSKNALHREIEKKGAEAKAAMQPASPKEEEIPPAAPNPAPTPDEGEIF